MSDTRPDRRVIALDHPANDAVDGFLLGNGALGATLYGRPGTERMDLNLDTVWSGGPLAHDGEQRAATLASLRAAVADSRHVEADHYAGALQSGTWTQSYQPLGGLLFAWGTTDSGTSYERHLDLATATTYATVGSSRLSAFVSHPDQVLVAQATPSVEVGALGFDSPHPGVDIRHEQQDGAYWLIAAGRAPANALPDYIEAAEPFTYGRGDILPDRTVHRGMGWAVVAALDTEADGRRTLIAAAASGFREATRRPSADLDAIADEARRLVGAARRRSVQELTDRHRADFAVLFDKGRVEIGDDAGDAGRLAQTYFDLGRYLAISSSRTGTQAANLQGIWNTERRAAWSCNYTTNINVPMNYWAVEQIGLGELHEPLHALTAELAVSGRDTARAFYGARGAAVHHNTDLWRFSSPVSGHPQWANWQSGLTWLAQHLLTRLDFDWSDDFARDTAYPALTEVVAFVLDQLVEDADGRLVVSPSTSPEHQFLDREQLGSVTAGSTLDQELAVAALTGFVTLAQRLGRNQEPLVGECHDALQRVRLPQITADGTLQEWADLSLTASEPGHRHLSHLYGCYPGTRITETRTPAEYAAVRRSLAERLSHGSGYTGWSQAWVLCLAARLREPRLAEQAIRALTGELSSESLLGLHPHPAFPSGRVFQIDGNLGAVAGMAELLVQSHDDAISLLPALPAFWPAGRAHDLHARGGHVIRTLEWERGELTYAVVDAATPGRLVLEVSAHSRLDIQAGDRPVPTHDVPIGVDGRRRVAWDAEAGATYHARASAWLAPDPS